MPNHRRSIDTRLTALEQSLYELNEEARLLRAALGVPELRDVDAARAPDRRATVLVGGLA